MKVTQSRLTLCNPMDYAAAAAKSLQSCPTLGNPIDGQPTRLCHPWDSPGKNTGVGCHSLFQCMKVKMKGKLLSRVRLFATPWTAAHQAPLSTGFSRQEFWSGLPFPSPMYESENEREVAQSCPTLSDPMDCSLPGSSIHGIFQARVLEWGAIAFFIYIYI